MKKFLSLVLALVMTMSLVTVSAGAEDFADDGEITYKEAVDVISALGIVDGYSDDSFRPDGVLTRGAAAKIICNLILGPTTAEALSAGTAPFKDVPVTNTFAGYITYCSQQGIISGYADGTFRPTGTLSGNAFMKMLLGALGYDSDIEKYTGANWTVNVIKQAVGIGLDDGNDNFVGSQAVTREEAALYAFNMLQATMVEYENQSTITVGGVDIVTSSARKEVANTTRSDGNIGGDEDELMQFAEMYFTDLVERGGTTDAFERPSTTWKLKSTTIGTYANEADASYTSTVKVGDVYSDLSLDNGIDESDVTLYVDGKDVTSTWDADDIVRGSRKNVTGSGNGALTEVYYDDDADTVTFVVINTYVGKIGSVRSASSTRDAYVTLDTSDDNYTGKTGFKNSFETEDFDKDDIVTFTYSLKNGEDCIESMELAESVTGTMTRYTSQGSVTVAGNTYDANASSKGKIQAYVPTVDRGEEVTIYLDPYGYVAYVDANTSDEYAVVVKMVKNTGDFNDTVKAELLLTTGEIVTVEVTEVNGKEIGAGGDFNGQAYFNGTTKLAAGSSTAGQLSLYDIVSYDVSSDDEYELTVVADARDTNRDGDVVENGKNGLNLHSDDSANLVGASVKASTTDGATIFLIYDGDDASMYEGFANAPTVKIDSGKKTTYTAYRDTTTTGDGVADIVFILDTDDVTVSDGNEDIIYIKGSKDDKSYDTAHGEHYEYDAFLNGEEIVLYTKNQYKYDTLVYGPEYNSKGVMVDCEESVSSADTAGTVRYVEGVSSVKNQVITLGKGASAKGYTYVSDVNVYYVDVDGKLEVSDINSISSDENDIVFFAVDSDDRLTDVYVKVVDETETVNPGAGTFSAVMGKGTSAGNLTLTVSSTDTTDSTTTFTAKIYAFALASGKDTAVEVGTVGTQTLSSGTFKVAPAITGTVGTQVYYAVVTMSSGEVVTTSTIIGG